MPGTTQPSRNSRSSSLALEDIIDDPDAEVKDAETEKYYLDQFYTIQGKPAMLEHISHTLFCISQAKGVSNTLCSAIQATMYLVRELATSAIANSITKEVSSKIESSVIVTITPQVAKIWSAADNLEKTGKNLEMMGENLAKKLDTVNNAADNTNLRHLEDQVQDLAINMDMLRMMIEEIKEHIKTQTPIAPHHAPYRDALLMAAVNPNHIPLSKCLTTEHTKAHSTIKERQLLIDPDSNHPVLNSTAMREKHH
ncbi:hypothetical protein F5J12DRAFT_888410 [Pisolithus orientalis]|uniref:uncharacterized protein n=1 Tax=Pisolithus orientalis TaxID=936130 RepID=UPI0022246CF2|nr:uncharacterized protein F5J12DRAFT_888410 [Pisolithus orientalis]KAI6030605.1 hypothetical protein F5J12DRAFT_888410 [Pisolithus orientalis]